MISAEKKLVFSGHQGPVYTVAKGSEEHIIYSGSSDCHFASWNMKSGQSEPLHGILPSHILAIEILQDAGLVAVGTSEGKLYLLDISTQKIVLEKALFTSQIFDLCYIPEHRMLAAASGNGALIVIDTENREIRKTLSLCSEKIRNIRLHPSGTHAAVASGDGKVRIFTVPEWLEESVFHAHELSANSLCWHPEGTYLLSGGRDAHLRCWSPAENFKLIHDIPAHNYAIYSIVFSPDGKHFATGSRDKTVKLWDAKYCDFILRISKETHDGHINSVNKILWSPHGLISAGDDRAIICWDIR